MTDLNRVDVAIGIVKQTTREVFTLCADSAESLAKQIESGALPMDAPNALRLLASMFLGSARRE